LILEDGIDLDDYVTAVPNWDVGDDVLYDGGDVLPTGSPQSFR
jgi:hypothetical protein